MSVWSLRAMCDMTDGTVSPLARQEDFPVSVFCGSLRFYGARTYVAFVAVLSLCCLGALATASAANAYTGPNPIQTDWDGVWDLVGGTPAAEASGGGASDGARTALWKARLAASQLPSLTVFRDYDPITLGGGGLTAGWKIGRSSDTKWLALSGGTRFGTGGLTTAASCSSGTGAYNIRWQRSSANTFSFYGMPGTYGWQLLVSFSCNGQTVTNVGEAYGGSGGGTCSGSQAPGTGIHLAFRDYLQYFAASAPGAVYKEKSFGAGCYAARVLVSLESFQSGVTVTSYKTWGSEPPTHISTGFSPASDPGENSGIADSVRSALLAGDPGLDLEVGVLVDGDWEGLDDDELLQAYAPRLQYDSQETYRADSAATITDNTENSHVNYIKDGTNAVFGSSDGSTGAQLDLDYLGISYPGLGSALESDYLAEDLDDPAEDAADMHAQSAYSDHIYGHVERDGGLIYLQYWFFYYYNEVWPEDHEGDWEGITIVLNPDQSPALRRIISTFEVSHAAGAMCLDRRMVDRWCTSRWSRMQATLSRVTATSCNPN